MNDDEDCQHVWGDAELCETRFGLMHSPTCRHCGAVKLEVERRRVVVARPEFPKVMPVAVVAPVKLGQIELALNL